MDQRLNAVERAVAVHEVRISHQEARTMNLDGRVQEIAESRVWTPLAKAAVAGPIGASVIGGLVLIVSRAP